jgi:hypothetical protein
VGGLLLLLAALLVAWWLEGREWLAPQQRPELPAAVPDDYDRDDWPHWIDADHDCQDTRQEVLVAESEIPVRFRDARRCAVASGRWRCPYTGRLITDPRELDVDHLVPLHEAHRAGGHAWDRAQRQRFANALDDPMHLVAVDRSANRAKSDKAPHAWMPPDPVYRCTYVRVWVDLKERWALTQSPAERDYIEQALADCGRGRIPAAP